MNRPPLQVVWLKRDLRLQDHAPLAFACRSDAPLLLLYLFEPQLVNDPHYAPRHWRFVWQSLKDLNASLAPHGGRVTCWFCDPIDALNRLASDFTLVQLLSHEETGLSVTFERDQAVSQWCDNNGVPWHQWPSGAVQRGLNHRQGWDGHWRKTMAQPTEDPDWARVRWCHLPDQTIPADWRSAAEEFQPGGESAAHDCLDGFLAKRGQNYHRHISQPGNSRTSCSRLSPYLAWGNLSVRQVIQRLRQDADTPDWRPARRALTSRLKWRDHFIQKFESECAMEGRPINRAYRHFPYHQDADSDARLLAWKNGQTGYPLVDASMRALHQTGYLNFRMRAMLVSFLCHHLMIDWRRGVHHLARLFLDFEPGIHYPQFQMQAAVTGIHTIRIYNPVKQSLEQDSDGQFIQAFCPELARLPVPVRHTPWQLTPMEHLLYEFEPGRDYPSPIIDLSETGQRARQLLWQWRARPDVQQEGQRILARHVRPKA
ncbi:FAD-binding domain-containing protein [Ferrimonas balearica]|uniref:FAD-binding domain-containing protein n=1 Tax=Ferrimonas balearica TaxID=44012 RepID=UPI001C94BC82|nr:deoxyribodipyrimidine photo-lyase [Ferrimonas balearica]MBY6223222.1 DNA photolyase family protein [Ferrimonas balearica]